jgi:hypothetical protein
LTNELARGTHEFLNLERLECDKWLMLQQNRERIEIHQKVDAVQC